MLLQKTLLLKDDPDLEYYRSIKARYGSDDYLVITYTPSNPLFSLEEIKKLTHLKEALLSIDSVRSITSILDVPLIKSPPITLSQLRHEIRSIQSSNVKLALAKLELKDSPVYSDLLLSKDAKTTALLIEWVSDYSDKEIIDEREKLREKRLSSALAQAEEERIAQLSLIMHKDREQAIAKQKHDVQQIRDVIR